MKIVLFANNWGGWQVARWLVEQNEDITVLVLHPTGNCKFRGEILAEFDDADPPTYTAPGLRVDANLRFIKDLEPDIGISAFFGYIFKPELIELFPQGIVNLHPAWLPYNRGWGVNVYPFIDGTPTGVTVHYIDETIDGGDIIARRRVAVEPHDTGGTLHQRLTRELVALFKETWPGIKDGTVEPFRQGHKWLGVHRKADLDRMAAINLDGKYTARHLLGLLRGLTYPPYPAAYYIEDGKRVYVRVQLFGEDELEPGAVPEWE